MNMRIKAAQRRKSQDRFDYLLGLSLIVLSLGILIVWITVAMYVDCKFHPNVQSLDPLCKIAGWR